MSTPSKNQTTYAKDKASLAAAEKTSRTVAEKALEESNLNPNAKPFVPASSTNKGGRSHRRKSLKKKTSKRRKYHRRS